MKKFLCLLLCLCMLVPTVSLAADYTLPEKMARQLEFGSGLKGSMTLNVAGDAAWAQMLSALNGADVQLRAISADGKSQLQLYLLDGEEQRGTTVVYADDASLEIQSELLEQVLTLPVAGDVLNAMMGIGETQNPSLYSVASKLLTITSDVWEASWTPALEPYYAKLEKWFSGFAAAPSVIKSDAGETNMLIHYEVPVSEVKEELLVLLADLLGDESLQALLREQMSQAQQDAYLNPNLMYYYAEMVRGLDVDGTLVLERQLTTLGDAVRTEVTLPLPANDGGYTTLHVKQENSETSVTFSGNVKTLGFSMKTNTEGEHGSWEGILQMIPNEPSEENKALSIGFKVNSTRTSSTDADARDHEITTYDVTVAPDLTHLDENDASRAFYQDFATITGTVTTHFRSKNAQSSPTTLEVTADLDFGDEQLNLQMTLKSTSPWTVEAISGANAVSLADMTAEQKTEIASTFWASWMTLAAEVAAPVSTTEDLPLPSETTVTDLATATDVASATDVP